MALRVGTRCTEMSLSAMATCQQNKSSKLYTRTLIGDWLSGSVAVAFPISPKTWQSSWLKFDPPIEQDRLHKHICWSNAVLWFHSTDSLPGALDSKTNKGKIRVCLLHQGKKNITLLSWLHSVKVMVHGKKLAKETLLPSVLEDDDAETESEKLQLGEVGGRPSVQLWEFFSKENVNNQVGEGRYAFLLSLSLNETYEMELW